MDNTTGSTAHVPLEALMASLPADVAELVQRTLQAEEAELGELLQGRGAPCVVPVMATARPPL